MSLAKDMKEQDWNCSVCGRDVNHETEEYVLLSCSVCDVYALHSGCLVEFLRSGESVYRVTTNTKSQKKMTDKSKKNPSTEIKNRRCCQGRYGASADVKAPCEGKIEASELWDNKHKTKEIHRNEPPPASSLRPCGSNLPAQQHKGLPAAPRRHVGKRQPGKCLQPQWKRASDLKVSVPECVKTGKLPPGEKVYNRNALKRMKKRMNKDSADYFSLESPSPSAAEGDATWEFLQPDEEEIDMPEVEIQMPEVEVFQPVLFVEAMARHKMQVCTEALMGMGFSVADSWHAASLAGADVEQACSLILNGETHIDAANFPPISVVRELQKLETVAEECSFNLDAVVDLLYEHDGNYDMVEKVLKQRAHNEHLVNGQHALAGGLDYEQCADNFSCPAERGLSDTIQDHFQQDSDDSPPWDSRSAYSRYGMPTDESLPNSSEESRVTSNSASDARGSDPGQQSCTDYWGRALPKSQNGAFYAHHWSDEITAPAGHPDRATEIPDRSSTATEDELADLMAQLL